MPANRDKSPRFSELPFSCECGTAFTWPIYHAVNITLDPDLLYVLLAGRLNVAICPNCARQFASPLPFLYHDMKRGLFAYVHPGGEPDEEERDQFLAELSRVYTEAVAESERKRPSRPTSGRSAPPSLPRAIDGGWPVAEPETPPLQIIFGVDRLVALVESLLEPEERLGHVELTTRSADPIERARLLALSQRLAEQVGCQVIASDVTGTYTVRLYGSRSRVGQLVALLHHAS
jgi:hypothetical protein